MIWFFWIQISIRPSRSGNQTSSFMATTLCLLSPSRPFGHWRWFHASLPIVDHSLSFRWTETNWNKCWIFDSFENQALRLHWYGVSERDCAFFTMCSRKIPQLPVPARLRFCSAGSFQTVYVGVDRVDDRIAVVGAKKQCKTQGFKIYASEVDLQEVEDAYRILWNTEIQEGLKADLLICTFDWIHVLCSFTATPKTWLWFSLRHGVPGRLLSMESGKTSDDLLSCNDFYAGWGTSKLSLSWRPCPASRPWLTMQLAYWSVNLRRPTCSNAFMKVESEDFRQRPSCVGWK